MNFLTNKKYIIVIIAVIIVIGAFIYGRYSAPVKYKKVVETKVITDTKTQTNEVKNQHVVKEIKKNTEKQSNKTLNTSQNKNTVVTKVIKDIDPNTGKVIKITDETTTTNENNSSSNIETKNKTTASTGTTTTEGNTNTATNTTTNTTATGTTTEEKTPVSSASSDIGLAVNLHGNPMINYKIIKINKISLEAVGELDIKNSDIGAGAAINKEVTKNTFVGVYGVHKFKANKQEIGVQFGFRF
jgi:hypothetical protein